MKDNKYNSLHLGRKYARIFVLAHYLFLVAHSFPRFSEQIMSLDKYPSIFWGQMATIVYLLNNFLLLHGKFSQYLAVINRAGSLYGRVLTEVCAHDRGQDSPMQTDLARLIRCLLYGKIRTT